MHIQLIQHLGSFYDLFLFIFLLSLPLKRIYKECFKFGEKARGGFLVT